MRKFKPLHLVSRTRERRSLDLNTRSQERDLLPLRRRKTYQKYNAKVVRNMGISREIVLTWLTRKEKGNNMLPQ